MWVGIYRFTWSEFACETASTEAYASVDVDAVRFI